MSKKDPVPQIIADRYKVKSVVGSGGAGTVLHAYDPHLDLDVAIKVLHHDETGVTAVRLQREAMAAGKLNHPNIAKVFDFGQTSEGSPYMVMEMLNGKSLDQVIIEKGSLPLQDAISIFIQICEGLGFAHNGGVVHRDLKPANVILVKGRVKLLDFGVAKVETVDQALTSTRELIGSPLYISPEQARGDKSDSRSDIYSLGVLMYECLTGKTPFQGASVLETIGMHMTSKAPRLGKDFPDTLVNLVDKCLAKSPEDRPQSISQVLESLLDIQDDEHAVINEDSSARADQKPDTSKKSLMMIMAGVAGVGVLVVCLFVFSLNINKKEPTEAPATTPEKEEAYKIQFTAPEEKSKFHSSQKDGFIFRIGKDVVDTELRQLQGKKTDKLELGDCMIDGSGLMFLADTNLVGLNVSNSRIVDKNVGYVAQFKNLEQLAFSSPFVTDEGLAKLKSLKKLKRLVLGGHVITDKGLSVIENFPNLESLEIFAPNATDKIFDHLKKLKKLTLLSLLETSISKDAGMQLQTMKLDSLDLSETKELSKESFDAISQMPLKFLVLKHVKIDKGKLKNFSNLKELEGLSLESTQVKGENLAYLQDLNNLAYLNLRDNDIQNDMIDVIVKMNLRNVDLSATYLSDKQLLKLAASRTLDRINVTGCPHLTWAGVEAFNQAYQLHRKKNCDLVGAASIK